MNNAKRFGCTVALFAMSFPALGQTPPDAGRTLQDVAQPPGPPAPDREVSLPAPPATPLVAPGGIEVELREVTFSGNQLIDSATLSRALGDFAGHRYDQAALLALTERITQVYRSHGYPFVRAFIPPQDVSGGKLRMEVIEGRYGRVSGEGENWLVRGAQPFLNVLRSGDPIESTQLERVMLLLDNQPGMTVSPYVSPGSVRGEGDLVVKVGRRSYWEGDVGYDNTGNQYTGESRLHANIVANSPFLFGDRVSVRTLVSDEELWLGAVDYELPVGGRGWRAQFGYTQTNYQLGKQYESLQATGFAKVASARVSYPLLRSQLSNLSALAGYQHKWLEDRYKSTDTIQKKTSDSAPVSLQFDHRDRFIDGGITYGSFTWTAGRLNLSGAQQEADATTARTDGTFNKWNLDVARIQRLFGSLSAYGRFSGQWSNKNLDSSERFGLGGIYGVRAYPMGEGTGDRGWLTQLELRYAIRAVTPFIFYDMGSTSINAQPWDDNSDLERNLSGRGLGVRLDYAGWYVDATAAWRNQGGQATADSLHRNPRYWFMANYRF
jgi:hemolysin activation/secretion protein